MSSCFETEERRPSSPGGGVRDVPPPSRRLRSTTRSSGGASTDAGFDAGARTIRYHLSQAHQSVPSLSTVHRVLRRRGLVVDQPQKRPRSSWVRFEAALANECRQSDMTHWHVGEEKVEILHFTDDCSRAVLSSKVLRTATAPDTIELFYGTTATWGLPACVLSDNGAIYTAAYRGASTGLEIDLAAPRHRPQARQALPSPDPGQIERYHQTLKEWLCANDDFDSLGALQRGVDFFAGYYNEIRPHQAHGRPPLGVYQERDKAAPSIEGQVVSPTTKVRRDRVDTNGTVTLRHRSKLHHIGVGRAHKNERVLMLVADLDVRILDTEGTVFPPDPRSLQGLPAHQVKATICGFRRLRNSETSQRGLST